MKKEMVHRFTITLAHITPIQYPNLWERNKESHLRRDLLLPNNFPWKTNIIRTHQESIIIINHEPLISIWFPAHFILQTPLLRAIFGIHEARHSLQFSNIKIPIRKLTSQKRTPLLADSSLGSWHRRLKTHQSFGERREREKGGGGVLGKL